MIITISGKPGSGKTTVGGMLAKHFGYEVYDVGMLRREMARRRGMSIQEYNALGETDPSTDREADEYQAELGRTNDNFIIQGRISFHFIPQSVKIFLDCDLGVAAKRIWNDLQKDPVTRNEGTYKSSDDLQKSLEERIASDNRRYHKYYDGLDLHDRSHYDLWIDTTHQTPEQTFEEILAYIKRLDSK